VVDATAPVGVMTRADFYILGNNTDRARFACILANKAWKQGHHPYILAPGRDEAVALDDLLWTFQDISFLPHALADETGSGAVPVTIGWPGQPAPGEDVLINLTADIPESAAAYRRIAEIVAGGETLRRQARQRFKQYRDMGFDMHTHTLDNQ
jgi:DNA polymerase-3 subunit chi